MKHGEVTPLKPAIHSKKPGSGQSLTGEQETAIRRIICDKRPKQMMMEFALSSHAVVGQRIERDYGYCRAGPRPKVERFTEVMSSPWPTPLPGDEVMPRQGSRLEY